MVVLDEEFKYLSENYLKMSGKELLELRKKHMRYLFAGQAGSQDNEERRAMIDLIDKELERRFKKRTETISIVAIIISIISFFISLFFKSK